jgi:1,2-diacylglycerol 3-alpha-glucosyltransferase
MFLLKNLFDMVKPLKLDIIHTHSEFSLYLASRMVSKRFKIPSIHTLHTYYPDYLGYTPPPLKQILVKKMPQALNHILRSQRCVVTPSRKNADYLASIKLPHPVRIIPNGIDLSHFHNRDLEHIEAGKKMRARFGVLPDEDMVIFIGRLGSEKNVSVLIENFKMMHTRRQETRGKKVKLVIVGDGPDRRSLEIYCHELGLSTAVIFAGYLRWPDEVSQIYAGADLFMSASHSEVHPISFIEAIASGLPIVAAADVSIEDMVINGENGWALEDDTLLWEKAIVILDDSETRTCMSRRSTEISESYTMEHFVDSMLACYSDFCK